MRTLAWGQFAPNTVAHLEHSTPFLLKLAANVTYYATEFAPAPQPGLQPRGLSVRKNEVMIINARLRTQHQKT
jgi:hypothetical protein